MVQFGRLTPNGGLFADQRFEAQDLRTARCVCAFVFTVRR